jgi:hypothetical protein
LITILSGLEIFVILIEEFFFSNEKFFFLISSITLLVNFFKTLLLLFLGKTLPRNLLVLFSEVFVLLLNLIEVLPGPEIFPEFVLFMFLFFFILLYAFKKPFKSVYVDLNFS